LATQHGLLGLMTIAMCASLASGCAAGAPKTAAVANPAANPPAWFVKRQAELKNADYPKLTDVPEAPKGGRSASDWQTLETAIKQAGARLMADPENVPAKVGDIVAFEAAARAEATPPKPAKP
jgi:hypothetical protein